ncbi:thioredoxin TrxA [Candidatus Steffania adelgidicola]|uniref:thioredoxin TrxA n=1 Tax=Candidatus Steffania adelgidicola TaxID=1076626 RepID=UPI001D005ED0|nr:thioredoxin TrxA [Candidatus Steffania adelgidicola]UDG79573.1 Thioredoxin 1 [Candidatus Steffania adelgidicola]
MSDTVIQVSDSSFKKEILQAKGLFLVDFWAEWCGPCKSISPILTELANEFAGKLTITKLNIDENPTTTSQYGIRSIPTLLLFRDGKVIGSKIGALSRGQIKEFLNLNP